MNQYPDTQHLVKLTEGLENIGRKDIVENLPDIHRAKHTGSVENVTLPNQNIKKKEVEFVAEKASAAYYRMGIFLGISPNALDEIEMDKDRVRDRMSSVLKKRNFTRQEICDGLNYIQRNDVIKKLKEIRK